MSKTPVDQSRLRRSGVLVLASIGVFAVFNHDGPGFDPVVLDVDATEGVLLGGVRIRDATGPEPLRVYPSDAPFTDPTFPSVAGKLDRAHGGVRFRPRHPFSGGARYRVVVPAPRSAVRPRVIEFTVARPADGEPPRVVALYPSADVLPENQLKLYLHFSTGMDPRTPYDYLRLVDADTGEELDAVFHAMRDGLWDATGTRLTIVFDPGRVKRGLANREAWGPPIVEGRRYRLVVDATWPDGTGRPLAAPFEKVFRVTAPDRERPDPSRWRVRPPAPHTRAPLTVAFDEALDHGVLEGALRVTGPRGVVQGRITAGTGETAWRLVPDQPWAAGAHSLIVDCRLEDLAGNNLVRLFDRDLLHDVERTERPAAHCSRSISFSIGGETATTTHPEETR